MSYSNDLKIKLDYGVVESVENDYDKLINKPVHIDTTAHWNAQPRLVTKEGHIYIYSDFKLVNGVHIPGIKIGDGKAYLIDTPFVYTGDADVVEAKLDAHIADMNVHVTPEEKDFWNNKVTGFISSGDAETLVLSKNKED